MIKQKFFCVFCKSQIQKRSKKFCSYECMGKFKSSQYNYQSINRVCKNCDCKFSVNKPCSKIQYCSQKCSYEDKVCQNKKLKVVQIPKIQEYRKEHSVNETAEYFGVSVSYIHNCGVLGNETIKRNSVPDKLNEIQQEFLFGNLLGDGSLRYIKKDTNQNSKFCISQKLSNIEYVRSLFNIYSPFSQNFYEGERKRPEKINGKIKHNYSNELLKYCAFYTMSHPVFSMYRENWYANPYEKYSLKIIPKELKLTWRISAIWMCDDGGNHSSEKYRHRYLTLHTNGFSVTDVEFLQERLKLDLETKSTINYQDKKPIIRIGGDDWYRFIENIKLYIPWECFQYKCINRKKINRNKSGYIGIRFHNNKWQATKSYIINGKRIDHYIGSFNTADEAVVARNLFIENNLKEMKVKI